MERLVHHYELHQLKVQEHARQAEMQRHLRELPADERKPKRVQTQIGKMLVVIGTHLMK